MKTSKIALIPSRLSDGALEDLGLAVAAALNGNAYFPEPQPSLAVLNDSIKTFSDALALAKSRDKVKVAVKNSIRIELETILRNLANYCTYVAKSERKVLVSTGFNLNAESISSKMLSIPENFTAEPGKQSGEVMVSVKRVKNASAYLLLYKLATEENGAWTHATNSLPRFILTGLETLKLYHFKMGVIGTNGQTVYTDIITKPVV